MTSHSITIGRKLRPLRLAFLVQPNDKGALLKAIRINTCLWGGRYNPIIPIFGKTPSWWGERRTLSPAKEILQGYLDAFEPDYVVTANSNFGAKLNINKDYVVNIDDILAGNRDEHVHYGISVIHLYRDLYEKEFQFVRRHAEKAIFPCSQDNRFGLFTAACFGDFPEDAKFKYFAAGYKDVFEAKTVPVKASNLFEVSTGNDITPLRIGSSNLNVLRRAWSLGPTLFYMDATNSVDIIDFWNLRALGWRIFPVPKQWDATMTEACKRFVKTNHRPLRGNPAIFSQTTLLKSRKVEKNEAEKFCRAINPGESDKHPVVLQTWYPRLWDEWSRDKDHVQRCDISSQEANVDCIPDDGTIGFKTISPEFASEARWTNSPKWANVVSIRDFWPGSETAGVIPPQMLGVSQLLDSLRTEKITTTSEGIVVHCQHDNLPCRWRLPLGIDLLKTWFKEKGLTVNISAAGRISLQMIRALGGTHSASFISHPDIVKLLNDMAHGSVSEEDSEDVKKKKSVRARFVSKAKWIGLLKKIHKNNDTRVQWHWDALINSGVLEIGLHLQCQQCAQTTWYPLGQITNSLLCERCGNKFPFPIADPPQNPWSYRTQGPFTIENYAQGAYVVAMALRFLTSTFHGNTTWATSMEDKSNKFEVDFSLWWGQDSYGGSTPMLIFGECKTFNPFRRRDVIRAKLLAKRFPGAILAFATLRETLTATEKNILSRLARSGRKHLRADRTHAPVMILTAHELTHEAGPPHCWEGLGDKVAKIAKNYRGYGGLTELCDATQQIHLGMESYGEWLNRDMERRHQRWEKLRARQPKEI